MGFRKNIKLPLFVQRALRIGQKLRVRLNESRKSDGKTQAYRGPEKALVRLPNDRTRREEELYQQHVNTTVRVGDTQDGRRKWNEPDAEEKAYVLLLSAVMITIKDSYATSCLVGNQPNALCQFMPTMCFAVTLRDK